MLSLNRWLVITLVVLSGVGSARAVAAADSGLMITLSPDSGPDGTTVTITGQGVDSAATVYVLWTPWFADESCGPQPRDAELIAQVTTDGEGHFNATYQATHVPNYGNATWQGIIYLAKTAVLGHEFTSNYVCFHFTGTASPDVEYFPETGRSVGHGFLRYWQQFGGMAVFGYPMSDELQENGVTVQYFERARFEWYPGADPAHYDVLLGLLGNEVAQGRDSEGPFKTATPVTATGCTYYAETSHNLCGGFAAY